MTSPPPPPPRSRRVSRALVVLFALAVVLSGGNYFWTSYLVHRSQHAWCTIIGLSLAPKPPPHPTAQEARDRAAIVALGETYGCRH